MSPALEQELLQLSSEAEDATGDGRAFVELATPRSAVYVGEPIVLTVRFGFEERFRHDHLLQLFARPLDVPAQVQVSGLEGLEGAQPMDSEPEGSGPSFALGETVTRASRREPRSEGERSFEVLEIERRFTATVPGTVTFPAPVMLFAHASRFEDDFVHGRMALDRRDAFVRGAPLAIAVLPLPEDGRPAGFSGAVGRFDVRAQAEPRDLELGASLKLTLTIEGDGNLASFRTPTLEPVRGFRVLGSIDEPGSTRRTITYDLAPRDASVSAVPALSFPYFDPGPPAQYRMAETRPIPILVRPAKDPGTRTAPEPEAPAETPESTKAPVALVLTVLVAVLVIALTAGVIVKARRGRRKDPAARSARDPRIERLRVAAVLCQEEAERNGDLAHALAEFLADFMDDHRFSAFERGLEERLRNAGAPPELAARAATELGGLLSARYGHGADPGATTPAAVASALALVEELLRSAEHAQRSQG